MCIRDRYQRRVHGMELNKLLESLRSATFEAGFDTSKLSKNIDNFILNKNGKDLLKTIESLTVLRESLIIIKKKSISHDPSVFGFSWNADFQLEDFLFVTLGQIINQIPEHVTSESDFDSFIKIALLVLENMKYSEYETEECKCIFNELKSISPRDFLRYKSTLDRTMRLIRHMSNTICNAYQSTMLALGNALNVNYKSIAVYSEALIRSNIIFHFSNLLERADKYLCEKLHLPPYVIISCLLYTSPSPRDLSTSRMPSSA
eukprot:TRINITY_DN7987_c0_g1_i2.p1 TRINITY_DN7987_c0_g1~~TRINITY_DN7987_c0_g1_i2.p1  ORF type:complete len:261 (+),score=42.44 TRINITY_DN7987_c0_g1_i2:181-963(+)